MLTCHNRKEKTVKCIESLVRGNEADIDFIVVDDGSTDGTKEALEELERSLLTPKETDSRIKVISGDGNLFYSGGMRKAMEEAKRDAKNDRAADVYVLANDDAEFDVRVLDEVCGGLIHVDEQSTVDFAESNANDNRRKNEIVHGRTVVAVGAMRDSAGNCSYGGVKYTKGIHYKKVTPTDEDRTCDTFNANFVAIPNHIFMEMPIIDPVYRHSLGDFDYGLQIKKAGYPIEVTDHFVGTCDNNPSKGTWNDRTLSRIERIRKKESVKGAPAKQWFYFLKKNFGLLYAIVYSVTPYIRIMLGK